MKTLHRLLLSCGLLACAPVEDLPTDASAPPSQSLDLYVSPVVPGQTVTMSVEGLNPGETVRILKGIDTTFSAGGCPVFLGGLCVDLVPPIDVLATLTANGNGVASLSATVPAGVPVATLAGLQAVARRGAGGADSTKSPPVLVRADPPMTLSSPDVQPNPDPSCDVVLPQQFWCSADNPEIRWSGVPANTVSLMFLYSDTTLGGFGHWAVYDIPPTMTALAPGSSGGGPFFPPMAEEISLSGGPWFGSCSMGANTYEWRLVALDRRAPALSGGFQNRFSQLSQFANTHGIAEVTLCQQ
jgi:phosphatidylethanolamine-binding protein (PEBP) family uncharacterized protein